MKRFFVLRLFLTVIVTKGKARFVSESSIIFTLLMSSFTSLTFAGAAITLYCPLHIILRVHLRKSPEFVNDCLLKVCYNMSILT